MTTITKNFARLGNCFAVDLETALIPKCFQEPRQIRLIQCHSDHHEFYYDLAKFTDNDWDELTICLENSKNKIVFHNAGFDMPCLAVNGIDIKENFHCTMKMYALLVNGLTNKSLKLRDVAKEMCGIELDKALQARDWMTVELDDDSINYGMEDVRATFAAFKTMHPQLIEHGLEIAYEIEMRAEQATTQMEQTGILIDRELLDEYYLNYNSEKEVALSQFIEILDDELPEDCKLPRHVACDENINLPQYHGQLNLERIESGYIRKGTKLRKGFNPDSSSQLLKYLAKLTPSITPTDPLGKPSMGQPYLAKWKHLPIIEYYLTWKTAHKASQICKTLIKHIDEDGRIRSRFNSVGTFTGRYSSSNPNLQNVPRGEMRDVFIAGPGRVLVDLDYGGMELRAACSPRIANEPAMMAAFNSGTDIHKHTASLMFNIAEDEVTAEQRRAAKATNFGALYGSSPNGIVNYFSSLGMEISFAEGEKFLHAWLEAYPNIRNWHNNCKELVKSGAEVRTVDGRRRFLEEKVNIHTVMCNNIVQGSCASAMKLALHLIYERLPAIDDTARLVGVIHDETLIEAQAEAADEVLAMAEQAMSEAGVEIFGDEILLTAEGGIGQSWGAAK